MTKKLIFSLIILVTFCLNTRAQVDKNSTLYKTILSQDSLFFSIGFNNCDIKKFEDLLSDNLKFYHDKDGISDKAKFLADLKNGLCKSPETRQVKRFLVKKSTKIFPLYKNGLLYGAIHNGDHLFYEDKASQPGIAKFSNVWQLENGEWKLVTSFSFDHQAYDDNKSINSVFDIDVKIEK